MQINENYKMAANATNSVPVYTVLTILVKMQERLGQEAMHSYMRNYLLTIGTYNPKLKMAVQTALSRVNVEKIYKDAMNDETQIMA